MLFLLLADCMNWIDDKQSTNYDLEIDNDHKCASDDKDDNQELVVDEGTIKEINSLLGQQLGLSAVKIYERFKERLLDGNKFMTKFLRETREKINLVKTPQNSVDPIKDASLVELKGRSWDFARQYCSLKLSDGKIAKFLILMGKPQAKLFSKAQIIAVDVVAQVSITWLSTDDYLFRLVQGYVCTYGAYSD